MDVLTDRDIAGLLFLLIVVVGFFSIVHAIIDAIVSSNKDPSADAQWYAAEARKLEAKAEYELTVDGFARFGARHSDVLVFHEGFDAAVIDGLAVDHLDANCFVLHKLISYLSAPAAREYGGSGKRVLCNGMTG